MSKKQVTFTAQSLVWFDIRGKFEGAGRVRRDDNNIVGKFMKWLCDQNFFPARMQMSGGGAWLGAFWPEDAAVVKQWLDSHDADEVTEHPVRS